MADMKNSMKVELCRILLEKGRAYDARVIRDIARLIEPDYIRKELLESIKEAKAKRGESLDSRIPESFDRPFCLSLNFDDLRVNGPLSAGNLLFNYDPSQGYVFH